MVLKAGGLSGPELDTALRQVRWAVLWKAFNTVLTLWAVNANWNDDGWNVEANSIENPNEWNADNQAFSRNSLFFSCQLGGSFNF